MEQISPEYKKILGDAIVGQLQKNSTQGATTRELVDQIEKPHVSISPQMVTLEREGRVVRTTAKRVHPVSGRPGTIWVTPEFADPAPEVLYLQWDQGHWGNDVQHRAQWSRHRKSDRDVKYVRVTQ